MKKNINRIKEIIDYKGVSIRSFEKSIGASNGTISRAINNNTDISSLWLSNIIDIYSDISSEWLLTGKGEMLKGVSGSELIALQDKMIAELQRDKKNLEKELNRVKKQLSSK